jgi:hypothetical protein
MGGKLSSGSCRGCGVISLVSHLSFSTPLQHDGENGGNRETASKPGRGTMHFTYSGMKRPSWGFRKATTFHHLTAIYQRSLLHLLWVQSRLPLVHDELVLNEGRQNLIAYKKE